MTPHLPEDSNPKAADSLPQPPRLLDQLRAAARAAGFSETTMATFVAWVCRFILFHGKRHPRALGLPALRAFLENVVTAAKMVRRTSVFRVWLLILE